MVSVCLSETILKFLHRHEMCHIFVVSCGPVVVRCMRTSNYRYDVIAIIQGSDDWWGDHEVKAPYVLVPLGLLMSPYSVTIDPNLGGCTRVQGGKPGAILPAGNVSSISLLHT